MNIRLVTAVAAFAAAAPLAAQEPTITAARGDTFDLARAIQTARLANPRLAGARAQVVAAGARIGPAGTLPDPTLSLGVSRMLPGFVNGGDPLSMNQVTLMQGVPVNGSLGLRRTVVRADSARTALETDAVQLWVERDVRARYWDLYHTDRALEIMDRTLAVLRDLNSIATTMYGVGQTVQSDVVRSQLAITRMQQDIVDMRLARYRAAAALNALLARAADSRVVLPVDPSAQGMPLHALQLPELPPLDTLLALADSTNPEIAAAGAAARGADANQTLARRLLYPDLALGVAYGQRPTNDMLTLQVGLSLPVFARSRQLKLRDEAGAMAVAARQDLRARRVEVRSLLATAYQEAQTARRQVVIYGGSLLPQAVASYEAALAAYRVGRVDFTTTLDTRMALLQYEHDLHIYEAMFGTAVAEIDRLIGQPFGAEPWDR